MSSRRDFITLLGGAAAWPLAARAAGSDARNWVSPLRFARDLRALFDRVPKRAQRHRLCRRTERRDRIPLGRGSLRTDAGSGGRSGQPEGCRHRHTRQPAGTRAAKVATSTIPIVFGVAEDPVKAGLVASLNRPDGNATGINFFTGEVVAKRLALLHELVPSAKRVAAFINPSDPPRAEVLRSDVQAAARDIGVQLQILDPSTSREIDAAFAAVVSERAEALFVGPDGFYNSRRVQLANMAAHHSIPTAFAVREYVEAGGLMSYGTSLMDMYREVGVYCGRILKGAKPADLPVLQSTKFEFVINFNTAKALGLVVPNSMQLLADEVVE
jgi:ABC-type uncharacterized transport system substrate-binding protein